MYPSNADLHEVTWREVVTVEYFDTITGEWFVSDYEGTDVNEAHAVFKDSGHRYRVVTTHYRSDDNG